MKTDERQNEDDLMIDGELVEVSPDEIIFEADEEEITIVTANKEISKSAPQIINHKPQIADRKPQTANQKLYLLVPFIFLTVALLGGLRVGAGKGELVFWRPALLCLIAGVILLVLFFRAGLLRLDGWFSEDFSMLKNTANGAVLLSLFAASVQVFNSLLPEQGLPFYVVAFCFFWSLWNNLFADFEAKKLLRSLGALFGLAFVVKYLILLNLTAPPSESWWQAVWQNTTKEAVTWLFDLPRFAGTTGYIQFFTVIFYLLGLFLLTPATLRSEK